MSFNIDVGVIINDRLITSGEKGEGYKATVLPQAQGVRILSPDPLVSWVGSGYETPSGLMGGVWVRDTLWSHGWGLGTRHPLVSWVGSRYETPSGLMGRVWVQNYSLVHEVSN